MSKKKIDAALKEFQDSMGYDDGIIARKRGGYMRYGNKFATGSVKNYGYQNVIEEEVEEPELDALIERYKREHPFAEPWREQNINALAGAGLSALNQAQQTMGYDSYMKGLRKQSDIFNVTDNDALLSWDANNPMLSQSRVTDFRNKSWWDDTKSALSTGLTAGMATANPLVGLGAAGLNFAGSLIGRGIAAYNSKRANEAIDDLNYQRDINFSKAGDNVDAANDLKRMMAYANRPFEYALGGEMRSHGQTWNNGLTFINEGGTHEENPLEGVPSGVDDEGTPNLVEEGEVIWNNEYVFSNRLKVPEELKKKYKLGGDLTFADAIKKVTKESLERPNDPISNETNRAITNEFMDAQEALREEQQTKAARNLQRAYDEDFMEQLAMLGQPEAPMMGQGIQMPQQGMMQEGIPVEGAPIGFAFGGNKKRRKELEKKAKEAAKDAGILTKEEQSAIKTKQLQDKINSLFSPATPSTINDFIDALLQGKLEQPQVPQADSTSNYMFPKIQSFGGNKFAIGGPEVIKMRVNNNGQTVYYLPNGDEFSSMQDARTAIAQMSQDEFDFMMDPSRSYSSTSNISPVVITAERTPEKAQAATNANEYAIHRVPTGGYRKGQPIYMYTLKDPNNGKTYSYPSYQEAANKYASIPRKTSDPRVRGGYAYFTPFGDYHVSKKGAQDSVKNRYTQQSQVNSSSQTSRATTPPSKTAVTQQEPVVESSQIEVKADVPQTEVTFKDDKSRKAADNYLKNRGVSNYGELTSTQKAEYARIAAGNTGGGGQGRRSSSTSGDTIDYKREYSLEEARKWEADEDYQAFLKYMRANPNSPEAKQWMDYIQSEITKSGSKYKLRGFDAWSRLAEDGKIGPVHQATLRAANRFKALNTTGPDVQLNDFNPNIDYNNEVSADEINAAIEAANNNPNTQSTTTQQASGLRYKPTWQRDVPIWAGLAGAAYGMAGSPDYTNADAIIAAAREAGVPINIPVQTIGDYRTRRPFDERYLVNMANQNRVAGERTLRNTSGGNRAMDILGASALAFNNQQELGEIMRQAYLANRQDDARVAEFNRGTNLYNMQAANQRNMTQAHLNSQRQLAALSGLERGYATRQAIKDAWDAATMESLNSAIASIGLKGRENEQDNMLASMAEQGYSPFYWGDRGIMQFLPRTSAKKGGKLNKKKRRF